MEAAGVQLHHRSEEMAVTGLWEVVSHLPRLARILRVLANRIRRDPPDILVPIDYPDFNLRLAARVHEVGVPIVYYISPQVWAWRRGRIATLRRLVRRMIVIFPFEEDLYRGAGVPVSYVGHPLVDRVRPSRARDEVRRSLGMAQDDFLIALLPGSRRSEVGRILPVLVAAHRILAGDARLRWALALAPGLTARDLPSTAREGRGIEILSGETYDLLAACDLALTASGTATLEAMILGAPMLVIYRMHPLTWAIARRLVRVPHVAMPNLIAGERVVPEFLQGEAEPRRIAQEVERWIGDPELRRRTSARLLEAAAHLGPGGATDRAARVILEEATGR
jgi:lipid-A-disaccharide synthase